MAKLIGFEPGIKLEMRFTGITWTIREHGTADEQFLCENLDAETNFSLTGREVGLLCKICEQFNLIGGMKRLPQHFSMDVAARISLELIRALRDAALQIDILNEQEKLRREKFADPSKTVTMNFCLMIPKMGLRTHLSEKCWE